MVACSPFVGLVDGSDRNFVLEAVCDEDKVELAARGLRALPRVVERRDVQTVRRKFFGPRVSLPAMRGLRTNKVEPHGFCPAEYRGVAPLPVFVPMLSVAVQDVEVPRYQNSFAPSPRDQNSEV